MKTLSNKWLEPAHQRAFLEQLGNKYDIKSTEDWRRITTQNIIDAGGRKLISLFGGSPFKMLQSVFPEQKFSEKRNLFKVKIDWKEEKTKFLSDFALKNNITNIMDWRKIIDAGGKGLLSLYKNNIFQMLQESFPKLPFKEEWFSNQSWISKQKQRDFLEKFAKENNIKKAEDWSKVTRKQIIKAGGRGLLGRYGDISVTMLVSSLLYPESKIQPKINRTSCPEYQRNFLIQFAKANNIKKAEDWSSISSKEIVRSGGYGILHQYQFDRLKMLQMNFPDQEFKPEWFVSKISWSSPQTRRSFLEGFARLHKITNPKDWGKINRKEIIKAGGRGILSRYRDNIVIMLRAVFPEVKFEAEWFHLNHSWKDPKKCRKFLEDMEKLYHIKSPKDWGKITIKQVYEAGGSGLLNKYEKSLFKLLRGVFPEKNFQREWFPNIPKLPYSHNWTSETSRQFLDMIAIKYSLRNPGDWKKITTALITQNGGNGFLRHFGTLSSALRSVFPQVDWHNHYVPTFVSTQTMLQKTLQDLFPEEQVTFNIRRLGKLLS